MNKYIHYKPVEFWVNYTEYETYQIVEEFDKCICSICGAPHCDTTLPRIDSLNRVCFHRSCLFFEREKDELYMKISRRIDQAINSFDVEGEFKKLVKELNKKDDNELKYCITFTKKPEIDNEKWVNRLRFELSRKFVKEIIIGCIEHPDSNIHCHAYIKSTEKLQKRHFDTYVKSFGYIDLKLVKRDNGVKEYVEKDGFIFKSKDELLPDNILIGQVTGT